MRAVSYLDKLKNLSSPLQEVRSPDRNVLEIFLLLFSCSVVSSSLQPYGLQQARLPCPSSSPRACSNSCPLSQWCHPTILFSVAPSPPVFNLFQHQSLFQWVGSLHQVAKVLEHTLFTSVFKGLFFRFWHSDFWHSDHSIFKFVL